MKQLNVKIFKHNLFLIPQFIYLSNLYILKFQLDFDKTLIKSVESNLILNPKMRSPKLSTEYKIKTMIKEGCML